MKTKTIVLTLLTTAFLVAGAGRSLAHYDHDDKGWFDEHHHHHAFLMHNGHRGYWDTDDKGVKIFVNI
jgi:hypothetical protein